MARLRRLHRLAEVGRIGRRHAEAEQAEALVGDRLLDDVAADLGDVGVARQEELADGVVAGLRQREAELRGLLPEEAVRDLHEHATAVSSLRVGADGAAVDEVAQDVEALGHDRMAAAVLHVRHEAHAAGVLLERRIVEGGGRRQAGIAHDDVAAQRVGDRALARGAAGSSSSDGTIQSIGLTFVMAVPTGSLGRGQGCRLIGQQPCPS